MLYRPFVSDFMCPNIYKVINVELMNQTSVHLFEVV
jgi:hypothetical protein